MQSEAQRLCDASSSMAQRGLYDAAWPGFKRARELEPHNGMIAFNYGLSLLTAGYFSEAVIQLEDACRLQPSIDDYEDTLALALQKSGELKRAESLFKQIVARSAHFGRSWNNLGVLYFCAENYRDARNCFEHAVACNPSDADALFNLADTCTELNDDASAAQYRAQLQSLRPNMMHRAAKSKSRNT